MGTEERPCHSSHEPYSHGGKLGKEVIVLVGTESIQTREATMPRPREHSSLAEIRARLASSLMIEEFQETLRFGRDSSKMSLVPVLWVCQVAGRLLAAR